MDLNILSKVESIQTQAEAIEDYFEVSGVLFVSTARSYSMASTKRMQRYRGGTAPHTGIEGPGIGTHPLPVGLPNTNHRLCYDSKTWGRRLCGRGEWDHQ